MSIRVHLSAVRHTTILPRRRFTLPRTDATAASAAIEEISAAQNIINLYACIGYPEVEDEHLTMNSVDFHKHLGYKTVGCFKKCGRKFDTWYDMVWMEKIIGEHSEEVDNFIPFPELTI